MYRIVEEIVSFVTNYRNRKVVVLISFGILVHTVLLQAAFDIYFSSPIDHGMRPIRATYDPPASRVVFIVADGLRAEAIQNDVAINLNYIKMTRGSWGISHTRVPTESRPGHVALLGGIYEDPSAILKGWKSNPVDFDSVVNQSTNAWCWGGPSIINMFNKDNLSHIHLHSYDPQMEDFGNNNTIGLDLWVFEHVERFLQENKDCTECPDFKAKGNFFFLHLLGTDTAGHGFKPDSDEYRNNIRFVDQYIPKLEGWFEEAFPDRSTAYIFTADHGMTSWGSHGAGSDHETQTPFFAWGAGIKPENQRKDIKQVDIAPLISALIGINYPINSQGQLPIEYIESAIDNLSQMMITNVLQLIEIFNVKRYRRMQHAMRFVPFHGMGSEELDKGIQTLRNLSMRGEFEKLKIEARSLMKFLILGTDYYHNYYQLPLLMAVTIGIIVWIIYLATLNIRFRRTLYPTRRSLVDRIEGFLFSPLYCNICIIVWIQSLPWMYYIYFLFPVAMTQVLFKRHRYVLEGLRLVKAFGFKKTVIHLIVYTLGLRLLVKGFHSREYLCVLMFVMASFPMWSKPLKTNCSREQKSVWIICCIVLSVFPLLPVMKTTFSTITYIFGYGIWWAMFDKGVLPIMEPDITNQYVQFQHFCYKLTPIYTLAVHMELVPNDSYIKTVALIWAFVPILIIPATCIRIYTRMTSICIGFATYYLMVSSTYELVFLTFYVTVLFAWMKIESKIFGYATMRKKNFSVEVREDKEPNSDDFRRAFFFIGLIFMGFFGTGNIASLNSFDPMWVRCFLTVFSPFKMAGLIMLKIMVPFIFVSCSYRAVNLFRKGNAMHMFCTVLIFSDLMLLELLYDITNIGSWLEIGISLSQFITMEVFVLILLLLYGVAYFITTASYR